MSSGKWNPLVGAGACLPGTERGIMQRTSLDILDVEELRTYHLLAQLEQEDRTPQKELAQRTGYSVGVVNRSLREMCAHGLLRRRQVPVDGRAGRYRLTASGIRELERLRLAFAQRLFARYEQLVARIDAWLRTTAAEPPHKLLLVGLGPGATLVAERAPALNLPIVAVIDPTPDPTVDHPSLSDVPVWQPSALSKRRHLPNCRGIAVGAPPPVLQAVRTDLDRLSVPISILSLL